MTNPAISEGGEFGCRGLQDTYSKYPWIGFGIDWLAFARLVIAVFFLGPLIDPVRNV